MSRSSYTGTSSNMADVAIVTTDLRSELHPTSLAIFISLQVKTTQMHVATVMVLPKQAVLWITHVIYRPITTTDHFGKMNYRHVKNQQSVVQ